MLFGLGLGCGCGCGKKEHRCSEEDCFRPTEAITSREHFVKETKVSTVWRKEDCGCGCRVGEGQGEHGVL